VTIGTDWWIMFLQIIAQRPLLPPSIPDNIKGANEVAMPHTKKNGKSKAGAVRRKSSRTPISEVAELGAQLSDIARGMKCSVDRLLENAESSKTYREEYQDALQIAGTLRAIGYK